MTTLNLTAAPEVEPVTVTEAKKHARVFISTDDAYIMELILAARDKFERETGQYFAEATWEWTEVPTATEIALPLRRIDILASIEVTDGNGQTVDPGDYSLKVNPHGQGFITFAVLPTGPLTIQFQVGYHEPELDEQGEPEEGEEDFTGAPMLAKLAIKSLVAHWYNHREAYIASQHGDLRAVPASYLSILQNYR